MRLMTESFLFYTLSSPSDCCFFIINLNRCVSDNQPCPNNDIINDTKILWMLLIVITDVFTSPNIKKQHLLLL